MSTREARTGLVAHAEAPETDAEAQIEAVAEELPPNQVRLSTGQVVTIRETTGADDRRIEKLMYAAGQPIDGTGQVSYHRCAALNAISHINGERRDPIMTIAQLDAAHLEFRTKDITAIMRAYVRVNGYAEDAQAQETFRPQD